MPSLKQKEVDAWLTEQLVVLCVHLLKLGLFCSEAKIINKFSNSNLWVSSHIPLCKIDREGEKFLCVPSSPRAPEKKGASNRGVLSALLAERKKKNT